MFTCVNTLCLDTLSNYYFWLYYTFYLLFFKFHIRYADIYCILIVFKLSYIFLRVTHLYCASLPVLPSAAVTLQFCGLGLQTDWHFTTALSFHLHLPFFFLFSWHFNSFQCSYCDWHFKTFQVLSLHLLTETKKSFFRSSNSHNFHCW